MRHLTLQDSPHPSYNPKALVGSDFMDWPSQSPDLICIEKHLELVKQWLYSYRQLCRSKDELELHFGQVISDVDSSTNKKLKGFDGFNGS